MYYTEDEHRVGFTLGVRYTEDDHRVGFTLGIRYTEDDQRVGFHSWEFFGFYALC